MRGKSLATTIVGFCLLVSGLAACAEDEGGGEPGSISARANALINTGEQLQAEADAIDADLLATCQTMATDLGIPASELQPQGDETPLTAACGAVSAHINAMATGQGALAGSARLVVEYQPPVCEVNLNLAAECAADCDADFDATVDVQCEPGKLAGSCSGSCSGTCTVNAAAECTAECTGTCTGSCNGTCYGEGSTETGTAVDCAGVCEGTCTGSCDAACVAQVTGSCEGTCTGSCDVEFQAPSCQGEAQVEASVECQAACEAEAEANATCTEPQVTVVLDGSVSAQAEAEVNLLIAALEAHWGAFLQIAEKIALLGIALAEWGVQIGEFAAQATAELSVTLTARLAAMVEGVASLTAQMEASASVSVEMSGSVTAASQ